MSGMRLFIATFNLNYWAGRGWVSGDEKSTHTAASANLSKERV
tara:strand:- start:3165 stop:3293 length:129 start_codon:yes stop_codon:yes gene_type:complete